MAKIDLDTIASGYQSTTNLNDNFQSIEDELNDKVLYRDNPSGEPNQMLNDLDMNSQRIINLPSATTDTEPLTYGQWVAGSDVTIVANTTLSEEQTASSDGQSVFNLALITYTPGAKNLTVYRNGTKLPISSYTETDTNTITLNAANAVAVKTGDEFEFLVNERNVSADTVPASNVTYTPAGTSAVATDVQTKLRESVSVKDFGAVFDGSTDDTAALQAAIDHANSLYLGGTYGGGGVTIEMPEGITIYTGLTMKQGVSLKGQGKNATLLSLSGGTSTGIKCAAADSGLVADQITWGKFEGFGMISNEASPTTQIQWNAIGFSRWTTRDVFIEWFGGCTGISVIGSTLAGSGGPAQWYNSFYDCHFLNLASTPVGGTALNLGDTATGFEQVTTWSFFGGRVSASSTGTGLALRGTGCSFHGVAFEGLTTACDVGSTSTRGASANSFFGCYWEGNTTNRQMQANATGTKFVGSFVTGGSDNDLASDTMFDDPGVFQGYSGSSGTQQWEVNINNGGVRRPLFKGSTAPSIGLENSAGTEVILANGAASSAANSYFRIYEDGFATALMELGQTNVQFQASNIKLRNDTGFGIFTGTGSPESVIAADPGSLYLNLSGGAGTSLYVKESGTGNTGWVAK